MPMLMPALVATALLLQAAPVAPVTEAQQLAPSEQRIYEPGYAMGDVAIGDPKVADFRVLSGRRSIMLIGKALGQTTLTLWDQQGRRRHEIAITVAKAGADEREGQLRALLADFPSVEIRRLGDSVLLAGAVSSPDDLKAVEKIASVAKVQSVVRYVPPDPSRALGVGASPSGAAPSGGAPMGSSARTTPAPAPRPAAAGAAAPVPMRVVYEIELLEASVRFRTGSYATGIEPSGRSLFKGTLEAITDSEGQIFIGGPTLVDAPGTDKDRAPKPGQKGASRQVDTGIRLHVTPEPADARGRFKSRVMVETNLPFDSDLYDPDSWRRARLEFSVRSGEPFAVTGTDLLASPDISTQEKSALGTATRTATKVTRLPGVRGLPGVNQVPVFGSLFGSRTYIRRETQLLVILRPTAAPAAQ